MSRLALAIVFLSLLAVACAGEVTELELGERAGELDRFRDEIQPILQHPAPNDATLSRNCAQAGCHAALIGGLQIVADPTEDELRENFRLVMTKVDPADPAMSILLTDPLYGPSGGPGFHVARSFSGEEDCCYQRLLAFISEAEAPTCACP